MVDKDILWLSFANASRAGDEIDALVQALRDLLADGGLGSYRIDLSTEDEENHETDQGWATGYCLYTFKLVPARGRSINRGTIALGISFWRAEDERGAGWEGADTAKLYVGYSPPRSLGWTPAKLVLDGAGQSLDSAPLSPCRWRGTGPGGLAEAWFFCVRLMALRNRVDLEREVARPLRLLLDGRGDKVAFAESKALLPSSGTDT